MVRRTTLLVSGVDADLSSVRVTGRGEVWLGPIRVDDIFTGAFRDGMESTLCLAVQNLSITEKSLDAAQRGDFVDFVVIGDGGSALVPGALLVGEQLDNPSAPPCRLK